MWTIQMKSFFFFFKENNNFQTRSSKFIAWFNTSKSITHNPDHYFLTHALNALFVVAGLESLVPNQIDSLALLMQNHSQGGNNWRNDYI